MPAAPSKIIFANQLRGVCVLGVMLVHYTVVATYMRQGVAWVIAAPVIALPRFDVVGTVYPPWFDLGKFGVGTFFLISGFVIPFSLQHTTASRFLAARALRIYPTFWLALLTEHAAIAASSAYWHIQPPFGWREYTLTALLVRDLLDSPSVDWVSWTLVIELKFYLLAALLRPLILKHRVWPLMSIAPAALALKLLWTHNALPLAAEPVTGTMFVGFIAIGTLFHYRYRGAISARQCTVCILTLLAVFLFNYSLGPTRAEFFVSWRVPVTYPATILVFAACYATRARFRPNRALDALAAISYPLYLVHAVTGFVVLTFLTTACHTPFAPAALAAALLSILLATALHILIEKPTITLGHRLPAPNGAGWGALGHPITPANPHPHPPNRTAPEPKPVA